MKTENLSNHLICRRNIIEFVLPEYEDFEICKDL